MKESIYGRRDAVLTAIDKLSINSWHGISALRMAVAGLRETGDVTVHLRVYRTWPLFGKLYQEITVDDAARNRCFYSCQPAKLI